MAGFDSPGDTARAKIESLQRLGDLSLVQLAARLKVSPTTIYNMRSGRSPLTLLIAARMDQLEEKLTGRSKPGLPPEHTHTLEVLLRIGQTKDDIIEPAGPTTTVPVDYTHPEPDLPSAVEVKPPGTIPGMEGYIKALVSNTPASALELILPCLSPPHNTREYLHKVSPTALSRLVAASLRAIFGEHWKQVLETSLRQHQ